MGVSLIHGFFGNSVCFSSIVFFRIRVLLVKLMEMSAWFSRTNAN